MLETTEDQNLLKKATSYSSIETPLFENQLLTYKKAAQYLAISESYLRRLKAKGLVPCVLVSDRGVRFRVSSLNQWIEKREIT